ncbi:MAG: hypothetical protein QOG20_4131 [Pseudonocardiales bacterium]|jgi:hypothetical protein|nr:hypothetical protein [Pseudonocardiales bacterium]
MIDEIAIERVRLFCPDEHWEQVVDYDVVRYLDPDGGMWEFYSVNGTPTMSPYTPDGRPLCPVCGRATDAELLARRLVPVPAGKGGSRWEDRPERADAPLLDARPDMERR